MAKSRGVLYLGQSHLILLFHNIEAGNNTVKAMVQFGDWIFGGVILGACAPIVINSRSDSDMSKLYSICCACTM